MSHCNLQQAVQNCRQDQRFPNKNNKVLCAKKKQVYLNILGYNYVQFMDIIVHKIQLGNAYVEMPQGCRFIRGTN